MRRIIVAAIIALAFTAAPALADEFVNGYYRNNGTYVNPYMRTTPDNTITNNYSTYPNVNPYTGQVGTVNPYGATRLPYGAYRLPQ